LHLTISIFGHSIFFARLPCIWIGQIAILSVKPDDSLDGKVHVFDRNGALRLHPWIDEKVLRGAEKDRVSHAIITQRQSRQQGADIAIEWLIGASADMSPNPGKFQRQLA